MVNHPRALEMADAGCISRGTCTCKMRSDMRALADDWPAYCSVLASRSEGCNWRPRSRNGSINSPSITARIIGRASHRFERWPVTGIAIGEEAWNGLLGLDPI